MELTDEDVMQILKFVNESEFDQLHLEVGDLKLSVSKSGLTEFPKEEPQAPFVPMNPESEVAPIVSSIQKTVGPIDTSNTSSDNTLEEGHVAITTPLMGVFYNRPSPDAPPYVEVGHIVHAEDTVGLIDVMKLFTPVKAGVNGRIVRICVEGEQLVEYGQTLFIVKQLEF